MTILKKKGWMLMICPSCSHQNDGGKFCEQCGTPLTATNSDPTTYATEREAAAAEARTVVQSESQVMSITCLINPGLQPTANQGAPLNQIDT